MKLWNLARTCIVVAAVSVLGAMAACSERDDHDDGAVARLTGSRWVLVDVAGVPVISQVQATLEFPKARELGGNNSCNHFGGKYKASATKFEVSGVMQTLIGCEPAIAAQEMRYMQALGEAERLAFDGDDLLIYCKGFDAPLRFAPSTAAVDSDKRGAWSSLAPLGAGARQETAVVTFGDEVVAIGGFDGRGAVSALVEAYFPGTNSWRRLPDLPMTMHHANAAVVGESLYVVGFLTGSNFAPDGRIFVLEREAAAWQPAGSMPAGKGRGASAVGVIDGKIYLAGGLRAGSVADFARYDPSTRTWDELPPVPERRDHAAAGVIDGKFILAGGRAGAITSLSGRVDIFNPASGTWTAGAPMPTPRGGMAAAVHGGRLYVFGGEGNSADPSGVFATSEMYDPVANAWETLKPMATPRHGAGAAKLGDLIYLPGGATKQAFGAVAVVEAYTP